MLTFNHLVSPNLLGLDFKQESKFFYKGALKGEKFGYIFLIQIQKRIVLNTLVYG